MLMSTTMRVEELLQTETSTTAYRVRGWVRSFRSNRFIAINDGSTIKNLQCVVDYENFDAAVLDQITVGTCISVTGHLVESQGSGQAVEIQVSQLEILGEANPEEVKLT